MKSPQSPPAILEIIGYSGAGKTTLIERLIPYLRRRGLRVAVVKHTSHHHEFDKPGKDSHRLRMAGAESVFVSSPKMVAMFREVASEWPLERMLRLMPRRVDLVIAEGFKNGEHPCLEVFRRGLSKDLISRGRWNLLAVVGDDPGDLEVPYFSRETIAAIGELVIEKVVKPCPQDDSRRFYENNFRSRPLRA
ncbi:MAG: molybdopterin-guanine dinucleotide biosynthesis protein B [candidate division KSB1 bacterium]|nr:molybdopterin-guanine dinucleotide biosynthesis protein B [candidate division KSB1 bacterium]MDZ7304858.1 molybdopterin-guanine dinucleotide biosynthesis protein B [candidate division KSB1 bacterium]MDZ7314111.1 molybdopterin-guanine dinucleotide biosynthesis protein B [candidate division KSB1 bacterium]